MTKVNTQCSSCLKSDVCGLKKGMEEVKVKIEELPLKDAFEAEIKCPYSTRVIQPIQIKGENR